MPFRARRPAGGFRVMYEYANRLSDLGYSVHITYPLQTRFMKYRLPYWLRLLLSYIEGFKTNNWFKFNPSITMSYVKSVKDKYIIDADVIITTWWATALEVGKLSSSKGHKINLIQGFEDWEGHVDMLYSSYKIPDTVNVVVASYLQEVVEQYTTNKTVLIPNAIDNKQFYVSYPMEKRNDTSVCMNYSIQKIKGSEYGLEALKILKQKHPDLKVDLFGICPQPHDLPSWITYYRNPEDLCKVYNQNAIFISNSLTEGFGLVSVEAMYCGCALVCTDISGHKEYAFDNKTALLVEPKNAEDMADKVSVLIEDRNRRLTIASEGNDFVQHFSWDKAIVKMNSLIKELMKKN